MSETFSVIAPRMPTIYFIDDSATMREVIKIAFRKEHFNVVTCADAATALSQFEQTPPDIVITDVIMPDNDGYEVCQFVKQHERFSRTPVVLMSGVVNQAVAEKATAARADELIRKPFQPHELIVRVKGLLSPKSSFGARPEITPEPETPAVPVAPSPRSLEKLFSAGSQVATVIAPAEVAAPGADHATGIAASQTARAAGEAQKLRNEIRRLEILIKKLRADLDAEKQYSAALESHLQNVQNSD